MQVLFYIFVMSLLLLPLLAFSELINVSTELYGIFRLNKLCHQRQRHCRRQQQLHNILVLQNTPKWGLHTYIPLATWQQGTPPHHCQCHHQTACHKTMRQCGVHSSGNCHLVDIACCFCFVHTVVFSFIVVICWCCCFSERMINYPQPFKQPH